MLAQKRPEPIRASWQLSRALSLEPGWISSTRQVGRPLDCKQAVLVDADRHPLQLRGDAPGGVLQVPGDEDGDRGGLVPGELVGLQLGQDCDAQVALLDHRGGCRGGAGQRRRGQAEGPRPSAHPQPAARPLRAAFLPWRLAFLPLPFAFLAFFLHFTFNTGLESKDLPFWPVKLTLARFLLLQRLVELTIRLLEPPASSMSKEVTGASGAEAKVLLQPSVDRVDEADQVEVDLGVAQGDDEVWAVRVRRRGAQDHRAGQAAQLRIGVIAVALP